MITNTLHLRKTVKKMMVDADLGRRATQDIAKALGLNLQSLSMAMSGYREGPRSREMLLLVKRYLAKKKKQAVQLLP
ncbi:MAG: hypothetical protein ACM335_01670 [Deltaproteobacteria bacterium]